jgi:hypothetical protein
MADNKRPLNDTVTLILTVAVAACLIAGVLGVILVRIVDEDAPVGVAASSLGSLLSALAGYVIGVRRREGD